MNVTPSSPWITTWPITFISIYLYLHSLVTFSTDLCSAARDCVKPCFLLKRLLIQAVDTHQKNLVAFINRPVLEYTLVFLRAGSGYLLVITTNFQCERIKANQAIKLIIFIIS
jgi:hypothetical protein